MQGAREWRLHVDSVLRRGIELSCVHVHAHTFVSAMKPRHLTDVYRLIQFHAHWGTHADAGSEHSVNGVEFAGEVRPH